MSYLANGMYERPYLWDTAAAVREVTNSNTCVCVCVFYQVKARNCRIQKSRARPLFFHCRDTTTRIKHKNNTTRLAASKRFIAVCFSPRTQHRASAPDTPAERDSFTQVELTGEFQLPVVHQDVTWLFL